jgi:hypothetical protein
MKSTDHILSGLPDCDDVLRRLANALRMPATCRKRACRRAVRCQGGYGPPCYFAHRSFFADAVRDRMHEVREYWAKQRQDIEAILRQ